MKYARWTATHVVPFAHLFPPPDVHAITARIHGRVLL